MAGRNSSQRLPVYGHHKATGQARVYLNGRDYYLGEYNSPESRIKYGELVGRYLSGQLIESATAERQAQQAPALDCSPCIAELLLAFKAHAESYYTKHGKPTAEVDCFTSAMKPLAELYGPLPVKDFTPAHLKIVRKKYIANGWSRGFCNKSTNRVRHIFKWGVEESIVPATTWQALMALLPLKAGKCSAPDYPKRESVDDERIEAVRPHLSSRNRDLYDLLRFTGARPSEILSLTMADIDTTAEEWVADLKDHKNAHRGQSRKLFFGPKSQMVLRRCPAVGPLFRIRRDSFSAALKRACLAANIKPFPPYCLRHTKITEVRDKYGIESAQATGGHAKPDMTANYSRNTDKLARDVASRCG